MLNFAGHFAGLARAFPGVWHDAHLKWAGLPTLDAGGSIVAPGAVKSTPCRVQFDAVTEEMRKDADFKECDVSMLILGDGLIIPADTEAYVVVATGPRAGRWSIRSTSIDPASIGYLSRGRYVA